MDFLSILLIAIGLAMDCLAVSFSLGLSAKKIHIKDVLILSFSFGFFQAIMPLIGYGIGQLFVKEMRSFDHWIAFIILGMIGGKMIYDSLKKQKDEEISHEIAAELNEKRAINFNRLILLSIATSIDALASGLIFVPFPSTIGFAISVIGFVSFFLTFVGVNAGHRFGKKFNFNFELIGGIVLIGIGLKILIEHLIEEGSFF